RKSPFSYFCALRRMRGSHTPMMITMMLGCNRYAIANEWHNPCPENEHGTKRIYRVGPRSN
ncbi:MAG: hypothetical protein ACXVH6_03055, partial [Halobacteriota archaeon]